jgi:L-alanine-DL-glutamate epimerase-like enolase superfamily enzyme
MALWDLRGKAAGWPLYRLLGGAARPIPAYAGGVSLGWQEPASLVEEARALAEAGFRAVNDNGGYFEADVSRQNLFRDSLTSRPYEVGGDGCVRPLAAPGIGVEVDEAFLAKHPVIEGPSYV